MNTSDTHFKVAVGDTTAAWRRIHERQAKAAVIKSTPQASERRKWTIPLSVGAVMFVATFWAIMSIFG